MTPEQAIKVVQRVALLALQHMSLEDMLTGAHGFGLVDATPLQRAICRVIEGEPLAELKDHPHVLEAIGASAPEVQPDEVSLLSGTRTAKSMIAGAIAVRATQKCQIDQLSPGEIPRFSIVSLRKDNADVVFGHIKGTVLARPALAALLLDKPTADTLLIRSATGRPCEIKVVAGSAAGATLVSRWSIGVAFDEWPRMVGGGEGVINYDDMRAAILSRLLPGAQVFNLGSPWAPFGPAYEQRKKHFGRPSKAHVFIHAKPASRMNPSWWTEERAANLRLQDADAHRTDYEADFLEPGELFFASSLLERAVRGYDALPPKPGHTYYAAMDPATRSNAWTLVVGTRRHNVRQVVLAVQWKPEPGKPLSPSAVFKDIAKILKPYRVETLKSDGWSFDALRDDARDAGLTLVLQEVDDAYERYGRVATWLTRDWLEIPNDPQLVDDLKRVQKRVTQEGIKIVLPLTGVTGSKRHCDYAPAIVRLATSLYEDYEAPLPEQGTPEYAEHVAAAIEDDEERDFAAKQERTRIARQSDRFAHLRGRQA